MKIRPSARERRRFTQLMAASGAAVLAGASPGSRARAATPRKKPARARKPVPPAVEKEIRAQKKSLDETLKVVRAFELPPGSPTAFIFHAMPARKER
jgi:hypothetical protein